jgi:hypothetical protein
MQQREGGDTKEADRAIAATLAMGQRFTQESTTILESLVGLSMEKIALRGLDPAGELPAFMDRSVEDYQASLDAHSRDIKAVMKDPFETMQALSNESDLLEYMRRLHELGEVSALRWLEGQKNQAP